MNISAIADMIRADPSVVSDPVKFVFQMNEQTIEQVVKTRDVIAEEVRTVSIAELNGGPATEKDVQDALDYLRQEPLVAQAKEISEKLIAAAESGEVIDAATMIQKATDAAIEVTSK